MALKFNPVIQMATDMEFHLKGHKNVDTQYKGQDLASKNRGVRDFKTHQIN